MRPVQQRRCYIHIGTHKTGTTSLQDTLTRNSDILAEADVLVARSGRPVALAGSPLIGNQNLAWQMLADPRFDTSFGTIADFENELTRSTLRDAIVTSEDLALAFDRPEKLAMLRDACVRAGYVPKIIVYLRDQATYAQSLYAMFVIRGKLPIGFDQFCEYVFTLREIGWGENRFPFDYRSLLEPFAECFGREHLIARPYRRDVAADFLVRDFLSLVETSQRIATDGLVVGPRLNEAGGVLAVMEALHENCRATRGDLAPPLEIAKTTAVAEHVLRGRYKAIGPREAERFRQSFAESNAELAVGFGVRVECHEVVSSPDLRMQRDFIRACSQAWQLEIAA